MIVFVKNARLGHAKTRLARSVGDRKALEIYQRLCRYTRDVAKEVDAEREVSFSEHVEKDCIWQGEEFEHTVQQGKDLGARMNHAFAKAFGKGAERIVLIGSDCAELTAEIIVRSFEVLEQHDVVLGPAADGGYYLIGLSRPAPALFKGIAWSTGEVLSETLQIAEGHKLGVCLLEKLNDVDEIEDWETVKHRLKS